jgi:hypothetical protein
MDISCLPLETKISKAKDILNIDGAARKNSAKEKFNVSGLGDYKSFKQVDNEGKNIFDFATSSAWNVRKQIG